MSDININCVFCGETTLYKTIKFTLETLQKCINVLEYRQSKPVLRKTRTTYKNIILSIESSLNEVYHAQCYKLFTSIKIPLDIQYLQQQSLLERNKTSEVSGDSFESHAPVSGECFKNIDSTSTEASGTSINEAGEPSNIQEDIKDFNHSFNTNESAAHNVSALQTCFICEKQRKRHHRREVRLSISKLKSIENLQNAAAEQNDIPMLEKLSSFSNDSNISYHKCCKDQYLREISRGENSEFLRKLKVFDPAYIILCNMVEERVVKNNECLLFDDIKKEYQKLLEQQCSLMSTAFTISSFPDRHLERKLMKTFDKKIKILFAIKKKFLAPFSATLLIYRNFFKTLAANETIQSVATQLREEIYNTIKRESPENCMAENLMMGECDYFPTL